MHDESISGNAPAWFDRQLASLNENPGVIKTRAWSDQVVPPLGVGGAQMFHVQTYRDPERGDFVVLQVAGERTTRLVLPPKVVEAIARQRDALQTKVRRVIGKRLAEDRKAQGIEPAFLTRRAK